LTLRDDRIAQIYYSKSLSSEWDTYTTRAQGAWSYIEEDWRIQIRIPTFNGGEGVEYEFALDEVTSTQAEDETQSQSNSPRLRRGAPDGFASSVVIRARQSSRLPVQFPANAPSARSMKHRAPRTSARPKNKFRFASVSPCLS
jgi:hypothetical protein